MVNLTEETGSTGIIRAKTVIINIITTKCGMTKERRRATRPKDRRRIRTLDRRRTRTCIDRNEITNIKAEQTP